MRVVVAFVPVDEENTIMYIRFYQNMFNIPLLKEFMNYIFSLFNIKVAHEDRVIVETQMPKKTDLKMGKTLIPADMPIIEYRKKRAEMIEKENIQ